MALTVREVRDRVAAAAEALPGWTESRYAYGVFPADGDSFPQLHHAFAVGCPTTVPTRDDRQSARGDAVERGTVATTTVSVRWVHRLRADAQVGDYGEALDAETKLLNGILALEAVPGLSVVLARAARSTTSDGAAVVGQLDFTTLHWLALE